MDSWIPNLASDMKYELFLPLCTVQINSEWSSSGFTNIMDSCFDKLTVSEYSQAVLYNEHLYEKGEKLNETPVLVSE
jgi:hypothetical protein